MIAAVNGGSYGGGTEMVLNCDIVIASAEAVFALPEVKRGVIASMGGACRLCALLRLRLTWQQSYRGSLESLVTSLRQKCCSSADPCLQRRLRRASGCELSYVCGT